MKKIAQISFLITIILVSCFSCRKDGCTDPNAINYDPNAKKDNGSCYYFTPTPYALEIPSLFNQYLPEPNIPSDNSLTVEGIALGKKLFSDPILSGDNTISCAHCHIPSSAFSDTSRYSLGIDFIAGDRNSMPIMNHAWNYNQLYFWDGRAFKLEGQAFGPVANPIEMHESWINAVSELQATSDYPSLFYYAFGTSVIDSVLVTKAIAQYERTLISANSKFDRYLQGSEMISLNEMNGFEIFMSEDKGDCFHCHGDPTNPLWTDNSFHNNGIDASFSDLGLGGVSGNAADNGKFKTPTLRNLIFTPPYMHDGRFSTIEDVIEHYSSGLQYSPTIDPLMKNVTNGGAQLTNQEKLDLKAFLVTLTDSSFVQNN